MWRRMFVCNSYLKSEFTPDEYFDLVKAAERALLCSVPPKPIKEVLAGTASRMFWVPVMAN